MLLANLTSGFLLAAGLILLTMVLLRRSRRRVSESTLASARSGAALPAQTSRLPNELDRLQLDMFDTARDMKAELDSKLSALATLVRSAQDETARLETAIDRAERLGITERRDPLDVIESGVGSDAVLDDCDIGSTIRVEKRLQAAIHALAARGVSAAGIARETSLPVGDVELLLSLNGKPQETTQDGSVQSPWHKAAGR